MQEVQNTLFQFIDRYLPLSDQEKQAIIDLGIVKSFKKGTILLREGQRSLDYYFVIKGCIRVYYVIEGEERTTAFYLDADPFNPSCSINRMPSEYFVDSVEDTVLLVANADKEQQIFRQFPRFETLCRLLSEDLLAKSQSSFDQFKNTSPEQRYLQLLDTRPELIQRVPLHQLASYLGITAQSLSRIRNRLKKKAAPRTT